MEPYDEQEILDKAAAYKLNIDEALRYVDFLRNKINY